MLNNVTQVSYNNLFSENDTNLFFFKPTFPFPSVFPNSFHKNYHQSYERNDKQDEK